MSFDKIRQSDFFKDFDWKGLMTEELARPYVPKQLRT